MRWQVKPRLKNQNSLIHLFRSFHTEKKKLYTLYCFDFCVSLFVSGHVYTVNMCESILLIYREFFSLLRRGRALVRSLFISITLIVLISFCLCVSFSVIQSSIEFEIREISYSKKNKKTQQQQHEQSGNKRTCTKGFKQQQYFCLIYLILHIPATSI